jgi:hypothetical protein
MRTLFRRAAPLALALAVVACGDDEDSLGPTVDDVAGSYTATTFTVNELNLLAIGASVSATLDADGTTTGRLLVPGGGEGGSDLDEDLTGTWELTGSTVTFSQTGSSLITDVEFAVGPGTLAGEGIYQGAVLVVVLTRDE